MSISVWLLALMVALSVHSIIGGSVLLSKHSCNTGLSLWSQRMNRKIKLSSGNLIFNAETHGHFSNKLFGRSVRGGSTADTTDVKNRLSRRKKRIDADYSVAQIESSVKNVLLSINNAVIVVQSTVGAGIEAFQGYLSRIPPTTRVLVVISMLLSLVDKVAEISGFPHFASLFYPLVPSLSDPADAWRLVTSSLFFGKFGIRLLYSLYYLIMTSSSLENGIQSIIAPNAYNQLLSLQVLVAGALSVASGYNFIAGPVLSSLVALYSVLRPQEEMRVIFGILVKLWQLPFVMIVTDCVLRQSLVAAIPHLIGIISATLSLGSLALFPSLYRTLLGPGSGSHVLPVAIQRITEPFPIPSISQILTALGISEYATDSLGGIKGLQQRTIG